ncbi:c-type cytochrome [Bacillus marasmi]|uniref:c-type cytochrome n=1 Tax=Bacillus marasmi TaxID=1926279 RepID=UPI0011C84008|nr:cytochrome c [Bacillus marasmi]
MKRLWLLSVLILIITAGCSANAADGPKDGPGLYEQKCSACHGSDLKGAAAGPAVLNMKSKYTTDELEKLMLDGKGMMPGKLLTEEENKLVSEWLMTK